MSAIGTELLIPDFSGSVSYRGQGRPGFSIAALRLFGNWQLAPTSKRAAVFRASAAAVIISHLSRRRADRMRRRHDRH
jgi:hypothetical protein